MSDSTVRRLRECVEQWPECHTGAYDPRCCRFPKSCSADVYGDGTEESLLEVVTTGQPDDPAETDPLAGEVYVDIGDDAVFPSNWEPLGGGQPNVCTRSPEPGAPAFAFCDDCGHAVLLHSRKGPCVPCQLLADGAARGVPVYLPTLPVVDGETRWPM